jgi:hypothetical protein
VVACYQLERRQQPYGFVAARERSVAHEAAAQYSRLVGEGRMTRASTRQGKRGRQRSRSSGETRAPRELLGRDPEHRLRDEQEVFNGQPFHSDCKLPSNH